MRPIARPCRSRSLLGTLLGAAALGSLAAPAGALAACPAVPTTRAFVGFGDLAHYSLIPDGGLESGGDGWTLDDAAVQPGNESFYLRSLADRHAVQVDPGGQAISPAFCVGVEHPTFRFVMRQAGGEDEPDLGVYIRFVREDGTMKDQKIQTVSGSANHGWRPSPVFDLYGKLGFSQSSATTTARVLLAVEDEAGGSWQVDDVFVDPYKKR